MSTSVLEKVATAARDAEEGKQAAEREAELRERETFAADYRECLTRLAKTAKPRGGDAELLTQAFVEGHDPNVDLSLMQQFAELSAELTAEPTCEFLSSQLARCGEILDQHEREWGEKLRAIRKARTILEQHQSRKRKIAEIRERILADHEHLFTESTDE